jgi:hypothetical protein
MGSQMNYETDDYTFLIGSHRKKALRPIADEFYNGNFTFMINDMLDKVIKKFEKSD